MKQAVLPELQQTRAVEQLILKWGIANNLDFSMPLTISINSKASIFSPTDGVITIAVKPQDHVVIDPDMQVLRYLPIISLCEENRLKRNNKRKNS